MPAGVGSHARIRALGHLDEAPPRMTKDGALGSIEDCGGHCNCACPSAAAGAALPESDAQRPMASATGGEIAWPALAGGWPAALAGRCRALSLPCLDNKPPPRAAPREAALTIPKSLGRGLAKGVRPARPQNSVLAPNAVCCGGDVGSSVASKGGVRVLVDKAGELQDCFKSFTQPLLLSGLLLRPAVPNSRSLTVFFRHVESILSRSSTCSRISHIGEFGPTRRLPLGPVFLASAEGLVGGHFGVPVPFLSESRQSFAHRSSAKRASSSGAFAFWPLVAP